MLPPYLPFFFTDKIMLNNFNSLEDLQLRLKLTKFKRV